MFPFYFLPKQGQTRTKIHVNATHYYYNVSILCRCLLIDVSYIFCLMKSIF